MATEIIFDTETNGLTLKYSVLSATAIKIDTNGEELEVFDKFYYPKEHYNMGAVSVNGFNKETIDYRRTTATFNLYFNGAELP